MAKPAGKYLPLFLLFLLVFLSRLPFLSAGFGVEEDSWGIVLAALHTATTGIYEPSRFPGHPVHEFIYSTFPFHSAFFYNFFSAFFSGVATVFFALILKHLNFRYVYLASLAFAFVPVFYISSTYTIDFVWTIAFILISLYCLLKEWYLFCGIFLGLAIGCRITSGAMLIPFLLIIGSKKEMVHFVKILIAMCIAVVIAYLPLIREFGLSFFMYYDQFPYPPMTKVFYKMIIGVWGLLGTLVILICLLLFLFRKNWTNGTLFTTTLRRGILPACFAVLLLFTISYFRLPQKSGYMITIIPFVIILAGYYLSAKLFKLLCVALILSSFVLSINLTDKLRGAEHSGLSMKFDVSGQEVFLDPVSGPVLSDYSKRLMKGKYTDHIISSANAVKDTTVVIAGWWYNEILVKIYPKEEIGNLVFVSYVDEQHMREYIAEGYRIRYLPEQNLYNDQMFGMSVTNELATPY